LERRGEAKMYEQFSDVFEKDPSAVLDYQQSWADWLAPGEVILTDTITPDTGLIVNSHNHGSNSVTAWLSGGTDGVAYAVVYHITTATRADDRTLYIVCRER
jgi:hypothetical protein